jgi:hypothetical protein
MASARPWPSTTRTGQGLGATLRQATWRHPALGVDPTSSCEHERRCSCGGGADRRGPARRLCPGAGRRRGGCVGGLDPQPALVLGSVPVGVLGSLLGQPAEPGPGVLVAVAAGWAAVPAQPGRGRPGARAVGSDAPPASLVSWSGRVGGPARPGRPGSRANLDHLVTALVGFVLDLPAGSFRADRAALVLPDPDVVVVVPIVAVHGAQVPGAGGHAAGGGGGGRAAAKHAAAAPGGAGG